MVAPGRVALTADLRRHGDRLAVVTDDGSRLRYTELADAVDRRVAELGRGRRLVLLAADHGLDTLVTYLAALHGGHVVLLAPPADPAAQRRLEEAYRPDVVAGPRGGTWRVEHRRPGSAHELHPELAVLLATSGSTGAPKLVRLSAAGLVANATAIGEYLDIRPTDRAVVSLPLHYCYGLSVVNSNLLRGAALLLTERSVTDPGFWTTVREHGATSLHGVPHTFDLLDRVGFADLELPTLRYVTQAGGRLDPAAVRRYAELGARRGFDLVVMYGQTEATARMAYLPPHLAATHPDAVGLPVPGGAFEVHDPDEHGVGELVYHGPNVMLGYAHGPSDLRLGRTVGALRTGDRGRLRPDGLYEVLGRRDRVVKPFGVRVDLDELERALSHDGLTVACTATADTVTVAVPPGAGPQRVRELVTDRVPLPPGRVRVLELDALPRLANGKLDRGAVASLAAQPERRAATVRDAFETVLAERDLPGDATFVELGGDSLSYVRMTVELGRVLGRVPPDWPTRTIADLSRLTPRHGRLAALEPAVLLRAVAIVLVVGSHVGLFHVLGGAHLLLGVAGWAFARFLLPPGGPDVPRSRAVLRAAARVAVPSAVWVASRALVQDDVGLPDALLANALLEPGHWGYWFVESLVQLLVVLAALLAVPAVRRAERARPFGFALALLAVALAGRLLTVPGNEFSDRLFAPQLVAWLFVLGWVVARADSGPRRAVAVALVLAVVPGFFPTVEQTVVVVAGLLLLLAPTVAVPRAVVRPLGAVADASLATYLTHYAVYPQLTSRGVPLVVVVLVCLVVGIAATAAVRAAASRAGWVRRRRQAPADPVAAAAAASVASSAARPWTTSPTRSPSRGRA